MLVDEISTFTLPTVTTPEEKNLITKIETINTNLLDIGSQSPIIVYDVAIVDLLKVQGYFHAQIKVRSLPTRPHCFYMAIEVGKVKLISVDCYYNTSIESQ